MRNRFSDAWREGAALNLVAFDTQGRYRVTSVTNRLDKCESCSGIVSNRRRMPYR